MTNLILLASVALAVGHKAELNSYRFQYQFQDAKFEYQSSAPTWQIAFHQSAQACFQQFKGRIESESDGIDLIDVCANPKEIKK